MNYSQQNYTPEDLLSAYIFGDYVLESVTEKKVETTSTVMRGRMYAGKIIESESNVEIRGINYYQRIFTDGNAELVRYNSDTKMWAVLCFPAQEKPRAIENIREAVRNNFDLSIGG